jgi:hypothetical protein
MSYLTDIVHALDVKQVGPNAQICGNDSEHGRLTTHATGRALLCGAKGCDYVVAVDETTVAEALAAVR